MRKSTMKQSVFVAGVAAVGCICIIALILALVQHQTVDLPYPMQVIIYEGKRSTHTALYVYRWPGNKENSTGIVSQMMVCDVDGNGISSYANDPPSAGESLRKCLDTAVAAIPTQKQKDTPVYLGATAGMRLLELQNITQSEQVMEQVRKEIQRFPFKSSGARILTGVEEGAYGWITVNYLQEGLIKHSFEGEWVHPKGTKVSGALDMGGASTQIAFTPSEAVRDPSTAAALKLYGYKYEVYTHSYLCFGKEQALAKLQAHLLQMSGFLRSVIHPCYHLGYNLTLTMGELYGSPCVTKPAGFDPSLKVNFTGSGDSQMCLSQLKRILNLSNCSFAPDCGFDGVYQPPVNGVFFAFSAYYYTFSFLGLAPKSSLPQVINSIDLFCKRTWDSLKLEYTNVKDKYLRDYCASGHYIRTVLQDGFKFNQGNWENIYFQRQVADTDIGWTLGYMLNQTNLIPPDRPLVMTGVHQGQWAAEVFFIAFAVFLILIVLSVLLVWSPGD